MVVSFNVLSVVDLFAATLGTFVAALFFCRSWRVGLRRNPEFLFAIQMSMVALHCACIFMSDNVVPADLTASDVLKTGPADTLLWYRLMFVIGAFVAATVTHFALRFAQYSGQTERGAFKVTSTSPENPAAVKANRQIMAVYASAAAVSPLCLWNRFLSIRHAPIQEKISFSCMVPFQPEYGPLASVYMLCWIGVIGYGVSVLRKSKPATGASRTSGKMEGDRKLILVGTSAWGVAGLVGMIAGFHQWSGFDFSVLVVIAAMLLVTGGLMEQQLMQERRGVRRLG